MFVALMHAVVVAAAPVAPADGPVRVYVAPLAASNADADTVALVMDRVLVAAATHRESFDVVSERELKGVLDTEAQKQAVGCISDSCAAELADALSAPQLVTGQLGHIGALWQLTLTRTERSQMQVLARVTAEAEGTTPERLLPKIPALVDELFGVAPPPATSPLVYAGAATSAVGVLGIVVGVLLYAGSWNQYYAAKTALDAKPPETQAATEARDTGVILAPAGWIVGGVGLSVAVAGAAVLALGLTGGAE